MLYRDVSYIRACYTGVIFIEEFVILGYSFHRGSLNLGVRYIGVRYNGMFLT